MAKCFSKFFLLLLAFSTAHAQRPIDASHYIYEIGLSDKSDSIVCKATIYFLVLKETSSVTLDLTSVNANGKGMSLKRIDAGKKNGTLSINKFSHGKDKLSFNFSNSLKQGDSAYVVVEYAGIPADGLIISKNRYGDRTFFGDNWPDRGHNWLCCIDDPADKASVEFKVTAPVRYQVVANGLQVEENNLPGDLKMTHWKEIVPISTKVMVIGVAEFAVQLAGLVDGCIPVYSWIYPQDKEKGFYDYALAVEMMPFFIKNVGPYGFKKLANVQSKTTFGGLENANTIFYAENSVTGKRSIEGTVAHEIAHQWFGNMATEESFAHLWLSEGFATYMSILFMESKYGKDTLRSLLDEDRMQVVEFAKRSDAPVVDNNPDYMELLNANSYQKGGWVLHMLRRQLGDSIFWKGIKKYYSTFAGRTANTDDLRKSFEAVSGKKMEKFFSQWLYNPGVPQIKLEWAYDAGKKVVNMIAKQEKTAFEFPLEIGLVDENGKIYTQSINVNGARTFGQVPAKSKIIKVILDPNMSLLFSGTAIQVASVQNSLPKDH